MPLVGCGMTRWNSPDGRDPVENNLPDGVGETRSVRAISDSEREVEYTTQVVFQDVDGFIQVANRCVNDAIHADAFASRPSTLNHLAVLNRVRSMLVDASQLRLHCPVGLSNR